MLKPSRHRLPPCLATAFVALVALAAPAEAVKTDILVLKNGDRLTGEVRRLERGRLTFKTDDMGTLEVEWDKVASVSAAATFEIEMLAGTQIYGALGPGPEAGMLSVATATGVLDLNVLAIGRLSRLGETLWGRIDGSIDLGTSYTSSTELFMLDLAATADFERPRYKISSNLNATLTTQQDAEDTRRANLGLSFLGRLPKRWYYSGDGLMEQNQELGFDLRGSLAGSLGRYLVQSRRDELQSALGVSVNREVPAEGDARTNTELLLSLGYYRFTYDFPKVDIYVNLTIYEGLNDWGRTRVEADASIRREMLKDFYVTLRAYESYDSQPATAGATNNDFGLTFALGWSF